jgi:3-hydroxyacyl-[acyl-carrier-protein] dehydratase
MDANGTTGVIGTYDIKQIMEAIPHRFPMLLIDRVVDMELGERATGIKNVSINEGFFQGHFPTEPVMPGVLIVESMAQTAAVLVVATLGPGAEGQARLFHVGRGAKFRRPVVPGDQVHVHVRRLHRRANVWKFAAEAKVDGAVVAEATYAAMIRDR